MLEIQDEPRIVHDLAKDQSDREHHHKKLSDLVRRVVVRLRVEIDHDKVKEPEDEPVLNWHYQDHVRNTQQHDPVDGLHVKGVDAEVNQDC